MNIRVLQVDHSGDDSERTPTEIELDPDDLVTACSAKRVDKDDGDISVTSTSSWTDVATITFTTISESCICICVQAYGKAGSAEEIYLSVDVNSSRKGGVKGLAINETSNSGNLGINYLTDPLAAGTHTVKVVAKVSGGTGIVLADADGIPLSISVRPAAKELS